MKIRIHTVSGREHTVTGVSKGALKSVFRYKGYVHVKDNRDNIVLAVREDLVECISVQGDYDLPVKL